MGLDDYAAIGGGALKLKGAKVSKKKKKKKTGTGTGTGSDLAKNLSPGSDSVADKKTRTSDDEEAHGKEVSDAHDHEVDNNNNDSDKPDYTKTESERRHEEATKKRLLQMARSPGSRPELLKTHKERVEQLNTYLSRLSEHHDMPKIGPG